MTLEPEWVQKWSDSFAPVYFVIVIVPDTVSGWIQHAPTGTNHKAAAYWVRFDPDLHKQSINVPKSQRFTLETVHEWKRDLDLKFGVAS